MIQPCISFTQSTQGFFLNDNEQKKAIIPPSKKIKIRTEKANILVDIDVADTIASVSKYLFGNNTNQWMGQIVTEPVLLNHIKKLSPNILRFPGGNMSNVFFWNSSPNNFPKDLPDVVLSGERDKQKYSSKYFYEGKNSNPSMFSIDNYYKLLQQTNCVGSICVNAGYARYGTGENPVATAAHYAADWVRYDNGRTKFWEVGNEDYGTWQPGYKIDTTKNKDHQPEITNGLLYGKIFKAFSDSMKFAAKEIGSEIYIGATIIELPKNKISDKEVDKNWNGGFFKSAKNAADFFIIHSYYTPYQKNSDPDEILQSATTVTKSMMEYMNEMCNENNVLLKPVTLTEWNIFAEGSKQQTSYIAGIHAAIALGEMIKNKYGMACRWDLANAYSNGNDHGLFNKGDEPGVPKWNPRPAYYYLYYFQKYFGDKMISSKINNDDSVIVYSSTFSSGQVGMVIINFSTFKKTLQVTIKNFMKGNNYYIYSLTGGKDNNQFSQHVLINRKEINVSAEKIEDIPADKFKIKNGIMISAPSYSVNYILIENK
ncbi:MAG: alpha-L-arabinofuranosidase [Bacteroidota bacterium]|nr:alpha-L-arabinofuranosidase [Bacteroidota bacterium]